MNKFIQLIISLLLLAGCNSPTPSNIASGDIDSSLAPIQDSYASAETFTLTKKEGSFTVKPVAAYQISAMVVGKEPYSSGWQGAVAPVDLALAWGKLGEPESFKYVSYSQRDRWYFYEYKDDSPFDNSYIIEHSANNHIIPASENILKAVRSIRKKQKIMLEGFLVNIAGTYEGGNVWWNSSLSRKDTDNSSCEVFYVKKVTVDNKVYE